MDNHDGLENSGKKRVQLSCKLRLARGPLPGRAWGLLNVPQNNMALLQWALGMTSLAVWKHAAFLTETHCHQQPFPGN